MIVRRSNNAGDYASAEHVQRALNGLSESDHQKLTVIATHYCRLRKIRPSDAQPQDLIAEAVLATLECRKRWRHTTVSIVRHLDQAMRNISGHWVREALTRSHVETTVADSYSDISPYDDPADSMGVREQLAEIRGLFVNDPMALKLLELRAQERSRSEIIKNLDISGMQYETAYKRVYRKLAEYKEKEAANVC